MAKTFSTSSENIAAKGKGKVKLPIESSEAVQLLADCSVTPTEVQHMGDSTPLINAWRTVVGGNEVSFCHSVKTNDNRVHIRDASGGVTTLTGGRDQFINNLLRNFHAGLAANGENGPGANSPVAMETYLPNLEDVEAAYRMLAGEGQQILVDALMRQVEVNLSEQGVVLEPEWKAKTEANLSLWST